MQQPLEFYQSIDSQACPNDSKLTKKLRKKTKRAVKKSNKHKKREKELAIELRFERRLNAEREQRYQLESQLRIALFLLNAHSTPSISSSSCPFPAALPESSATESAKEGERDL